MVTRSLVFSGVLVIAASGIVFACGKDDDGEGGASGGASSGGAGGEAGSANTGGSSAGGSATGGESSGGQGGMGAAGGEGGQVGAGGGATARCTGMPHACVMLNQGKCGQTDGCTWTPGSPGSCDGTAAVCSTYTIAGDCNQAGCTFN